MMTEISIIVPVYNAEDYISSCVNSVVEQDFTGWELLLIDDGSQDSSGVVCDVLARTDDRIRVLHKPNGGVSTARNVGIGLASGRYIMFLDSDDMLASGALTTLHNAAQGADFVTGAFAAHDDKQVLFEMGPSQDRRYTRDNMIEVLATCMKSSRHTLSSCWGKLYKRQMLVDNAILFDVGLHYAEDKLFVFRCLLAAFSAVTITDSVYRYFVREGSLGTDLDSDSHLLQIRHFLPEYRALLESFSERFPNVSTIAEIYHGDLICGYVTRVLNIFMKRKTQQLSEDYISFLYGFIDADRLSGALNIRIGQIPNMLLYKAANPKLTVRFYSFTSSLFTCIG